MSYLFRFFCISSLLLVGVSCKSRAIKGAVDQKRENMEAALKELNLSEDLTEIKIGFQIGEGSYGELKFCKPDETCPTIEVKNQDHLDLTFNAPDAYSLRVCQSRPCSVPWQVLLLRPIESYPDPKVQKASTLLFANNKGSVGVAISALGNKQFVTLSFAKVKSLVQQKIDTTGNPALALTGGSSGLENMDNTCYFNAAMQLIRNTPDLRARTKILAGQESELKVKNKDFFMTLEKLFEKMDAAAEGNNFLKKGDIKPIFDAYDDTLHSPSQEKSAYGNLSNPLTDYLSMDQQDSGEFIKPILRALRGDDVRVFEGVLPKNNLKIIQSQTLEHPFSDIGIPSGGQNATASFQNLVSGFLMSDEKPPEEWRGDHESNLNVRRLLAKSRAGFQSFTVVLKRQQTPGGPKDTTAMLGIEDDITVPFVTMDSPQVYGQKMRVRSFVAHEGEDSVGHYVCYFRDNNNQWFRASDKVVEKITDDSHMEAMRKRSTVVNLESIPDAEIVTTWVQSPVQSANSSKSEKRLTSSFGHLYEPVLGIGLMFAVALASYHMTTYLAESKDP